MAFLNLTGGPAPSGLGPRLVARSANWGGKALLVFGLALAMAIPGVFVLALVADREHRAQSVTDEVSQLQGGSQEVLGPMLVAPYVVPQPPVQEGNGPLQASPPLRGWYVVSAETGSAELHVQGSSISRNIFQVPVYDTNATLRAHFTPAPKDFALPVGATVDWSQARIVVGFSDLRGAKNDVTGVFSNGAAAPANVTFQPASDVGLGAPGGNIAHFGLVSAPAGLVAGANGGDVVVKLHFTGADRLAVMPFAKSTHVWMGANGATPSLDGAFPADARNVADNGFQASWTVPFIARGLSDQGSEGVLSLDNLAAKDVGVTLVPTANPYANIDRALKYGVMFVGLVFLTFFVFEALSGKRLHPAQYLMIGLAQMVFYLLLLSVSEYIGFDLGFAGAAVATVTLIGLYAGAAFQSRAYGLRALAVFTLVYGLIYALLRLEDYALLAGSLASFAGLAFAMYLTRNIDWYGGAKTAPPPDPAPVAADAPAAG